MYDVDDTIAAIASAPGGGARGIIRVTGPETLACVTECFSSPGIDVQRTASSCLGELSLADPLPATEARLYLWPTTRSFTGQPTAEFHTLGSPPLLQSALRRVCAAGARLAEPGEFTMRAFLAGRLDLPQAEAVLGVINARSGTQLDTALRQMAGGLSHPLNALRDRLLNTLADLEAGLDFVDEDIQFVSADQVAIELESARRLVTDLQSQLERRTDTNQVPRIVLRGRANAGKSTLWNALKEESADSAEAIVSEIPGTTRDYLTAWINVGDQVCQLIDTAGAEDVVGSAAPADTSHSIAAAAQSAAEQTSDQADIVLLCIPVDQPLSGWEQKQIKRLDPATSILVLTKSDIKDPVLGGSEEYVIEMGYVASVPAIRTSARTGTGIRQLRDSVASLLDTASAVEGNALASTATRCHESLRLASNSLQRAERSNAVAAGDELIAAELRLALDELGKIVGQVYTEDVLDRVFSRFCIGK